MKKINFRTFVLACSALFTGFATSAIAGDLDVKLNVSEKGVWVSNPLLLSEGYNDIYGFETDASVEFGKKTDSSHFHTKIQVSRDQYDDSGFNSTDLKLDADYIKRTDTMSFSVDGYYDYGTTKRSEISTLGLVDVGVIRRVGSSLSPKLSYGFSERGMVSLSGEWRENRYRSDNLTDYRILSISPSFAYKLTEVQTLMVLLQAQQYGSLDSRSQKVESVGPSLGWLYDYNPEFSIELYAGMMETRYRGYNSVDDDWEMNPVYSGVLRYQGEVNDSSFGASRSRQAYANGTESYLTTFMAKETFRYNEQFSLTLEGNYYLAKQPPASTNDLDKAWEGRTSLTYNINDDWSALGSFRYRKEELTDGGDADRNIVRVGLTYHTKAY